MNPEVKEKWTAALDSGEFTQGTGRLQTLKGDFCCLGVLCELYRREHPDTSRWLAADAGSQIFNVDAPNGGHKGRVAPSPQVMAWAELDEIPVLTIDGVKRSAIIHNDGEQGMDYEDAIRRKAFKEISAAIKEQL